MNRKEILELKSFLGKAIPGDYQHFLGAYGFSSCLREPLDGKGRKIVKDKGEIIATGRCVYLDWDSSFFGFPCVRLEGLFFSSKVDPLYARGHLISVLLEDEKVCNSELLTCRVRADDLLLVRALETAGFRLVDVMAIFLKKLGDKAHSGYDGGILRNDIREIVPLLERCVSSVNMGRILNDPNIPESKAQNFYLEVSKYYLSKGAPAVILRCEGREAGLAIGIYDDTISKYMKNRYGYLWFIGLVPDFKGRGLGKKLFELFCQEFGYTCDLLEIGTQIYNYPAMRIYERGDCRITGSLLTFHRWNFKSV